MTQSVSIVNTSNWKHEGLNIRTANLSEWVNAIDENRKADANETILDVGDIAVNWIDPTDPLVIVVEKHAMKDKDGNTLKPVPIKADLSKLPEHEHEQIQIIGQVFPHASVEYHEFSGGIVDRDDIIEEKEDS